VVTLLVARFLYGLIDVFTAPLIGRMLEGVFSEDQHLFGAIKFFLEIILTILCVFLLLYAIGAISTMFIVRRLYAYGERFLLKIPLLKSIYGLSKQIVDLVSSGKSQNFRQVARFEYPHPGSYALGFITSEIRFESDPRLYLTILMPTTPIPSQLFLMVVPADKVQVVDISIEDGLKLCMSGGVVAPPSIAVRPYTAISSNVGVCGSD
jgi:uncharacterized membrane protein